MKLFELYQDGQEYLFAFMKKDDIYKCLVANGCKGGWHRMDYLIPPGKRRANINKLDTRAFRTLINEIFILKRQWFYE
jgi:hypothetical protein